MKTTILSVDIDNLSMQDVLLRLSELIRGGGKHYVVTPNPEMIVLAQADSEFREILNSADIAIPDGVGLLLAARILRLNLDFRVTGTDLAEKICQISGRENFRIFFLGARDGVAELAKQELYKKYPDAQIVGVYSGSSQPEDDIKIQKVLSDQGNIDVLLVAYGAPYQEKWIQRNLEHIPVKVAIGIGGALDYFSGSKIRAPLFVRRLGFEWLYRLITQPGRFKRQLRLPFFLFLVMKRRFSG